MFHGDSLAWVELERFVFEEFFTFIGVATHGLVLEL